MSLDVYLYAHERQVNCECECCGNKHTRQSWDWSYTANITHNLGQMADAAGLYKPLWRPEEIGITRASQLITPLRQGLEDLRYDPEYFKSFNPPNGWGTYEGLVKFTEDYLKACEEVPEAIVEVSR